MGLLNRSSSKARPRIQRAPTTDLMSFAGTTLNEIGRALEAHRAGDPLGVTVAAREAELLSEMLTEIQSRQRI